LMRPPNNYSPRRRSCSFSCSNSQILLCKFAV
jgi:hypothetical protein